MLPSFIFRFIRLTTVQTRINSFADKSFSMLLELLSDALLEENTLPISFYDTMKII